MRSMVEGALRAPAITVNRARELRRSLTLPEGILWRALRQGQLTGLRFRRQHPVGPFILDFYCPSARLAVEIDGLAHDNPEQLNHDRVRDAFLSERDVMVLRVLATDVLRDDGLEGVLHLIRETATRPLRRAARATSPASRGRNRVGCVLTLLMLAAVPARADDLACVSTTFRLLGANDKVCVSVFDDPKVPGVACHISQARTGGVKGSLGLAEDPSRFAIACRQVGPISADIAKLPEEEQVYTEKTSLFFKHTHVYRMVDKKRNTLIYLAISDRIIEGSPQNSLSTVPVMPWGR